MERRNAITLAGAAGLLVLATVMLWRQVGSGADGLPADGGPQPGAQGSVSVAVSALAAAGTGPASPEVPPASTSAAADQPAIEDPSSTTTSATQAAVEAVESMGRVASLGRLRRPEVIREFTTDTFFPTFMDDTNRSLAELDQHRTDGVSVDEWALRATAQPQTEGTIAVQVWSVSVVTVGDEVRNAWRTVQLDMRQVDGVWLVDGWSSTDGPSPAPAASAVFATGPDIAAVAAWDRAEE